MKPLPGNCKIQSVYMAVNSTTCFRGWSKKITLMDTFEINFLLLEAASEFLTPCLSNQFIP